MARYAAATDADAHPHVEVNIRSWPVRLAAVVLVAVTVGWIVTGVLARFTVLGAFYDALGFGEVFSTRLRADLTLGGLGAFAAVLLSLPILVMARGGRRAIPAEPEPPRTPESPPTEAEITRMMEALRPEDLIGPLRRGAGRERSAIHARRIGWVGFGACLVTLMGVLIPGAVGLRDPLLAARHAVDFGVRDPVFGKDVAFTVFRAPAQAAVVQVAAVGVFIALCAAVLSAAALWYSHAQRGTPAADVYRQRGLTWGCALGGVLLMLLGASVWLSRYGLLATDDPTTAGPGAAARHVDIPTRGVAAIAMALLGAALIALAFPALRRAALPTRMGPALVALLAFWAAIGVVLVVISTAWWLVLVGLIAIAGLIAHRALGPQGVAATPAAWVTPAAVAVTAVTLSLAGPVGSALYDAVVLRGPTYQVERESIAHTLRFTRQASGLDAARERVNPYGINRVSREDIDKNPLTMGSLRMLDLTAAQQACGLEQVPKSIRGYRCVDIDVNRMEIGGRVRTVYVGGVEIDPRQADDFQRRHLTRTHGQGIAVAPVDELGRGGRPVWLANAVPQSGITPPIAHPDIYFGAARDMPWVIANSDLPVMDGGSAGSRVVDWCRGANAAACGGEGGTGIALDSGWRRFAAAMYVAGAPLVGDGRRLMSAAQPEGTRLLLHPDITARLGEVAPFLRVDGDPYFAPAGGRLWVVAPTYVQTARYPYSARMSGANYMRQPVVAAMDAYSGRLYLFVTDDQEPMLATWRAVYPDLFTPADRMEAVAPGLRRQVKYGEDLFAFQSQAAERYHVRDPELLATDSMRWIPAEQAGSAAGTGIVAPARYTFVRQGGDAEERFSVQRTFTTVPSGEGAPQMSGILTASSDPETFGRLTIDTFDGRGPGSLLSFASQISASSQLDRELKLQSQVAWGDAMVVPMGDGLLYAMPIYLESSQQTPVLFRVITSTGDRIAWGDTLDDALLKSLGADTDVSRPGATPAPLDVLAARAAEEMRLYREATASGNSQKAGRHLDNLQRLLERMREEGREP